MKLASLARYCPDPGPARPIDACLASKQQGCPANLKTGDGTGFTLVSSHQPEFLKRGVCARGPGDNDGALMQMPRIHEGEFKPYNPAAFRPYASRTRLFRTPNDAFLTANTHRNDIVIQDIVQPAVAALYSGAMHPTAQAHAIVADPCRKFAVSSATGKDRYRRPKAFLVSATTSGGSL